MMARQWYLDPLQNFVRVELDPSGSAHPRSQFTFRGVSQKIKS